MHQPHQQRQPAPRSNDFRQYVGINGEQEELHFLVPDLNRDLAKGVYLTMALARRSERTEVRAWFADYAEFWRLAAAETVRWLGGDRLAYARLRHQVAIVEQREVGLGYVREGHDGSGLGERELLDLLLALLGSWPEFRNALPVEPDVLSMAPGFGLDRTSDVSVAVGKRHLITYTQWCAAFYAFDPRVMAEVSVSSVWNPATRQFETVRAVLPVDASGRPILLVPKEIVRSDTPLDVSTYFRDIYGEQYAGSSSKKQLVEDAALHPGRLAEYARDRLKDPRNYRARRDLFPRPPRRKRKGE